MNGTAPMVTLEVNDSWGDTAIRVVFQRGFMKDFAATISQVECELNEELKQLTLQSKLNLLYLTLYDINVSLDAANAANMESTAQAQEALLELT